MASQSLVKRGEYGADETRELRHQGALEPVQEQQTIFSQKDFPG
ncbi:MAG: hypothetical protein ACFFFY_12130 [Promethearchaeota archaeon]